MFLKNIEIHGFKSFANKIDLQFHNGITGIVGPNGSGKSNVADAVRWVLGEQSVKQLRGGSMQDVIFAGTELRKPLSYAYVAITLDNSDHALAIDYDEVTVARRLYRSGESEYLLNGSLVRLKDINELFYDTGIGKEGYSIIGQGQIDRILSGKPEERRELFDEAAGIVKFKRRKEASLKKLENEQNNLVRVNDILAELERQVGPLEKQSEKAKVYLKAREEMKTLDVNSFLLEHKRLMGLLEDTDSKLDIATSQLEEVRAKYDGVRVEYDRIQQTIESLEARIEETRSKMSDTDLVRSRLEGEINLLKEQIRSAGEAEGLYNERKEALLKEIASREQERDKVLAEKSDADTEAASIEAEASKRREHLQGIQKQMEELENRIENAKNIIIDGLNTKATIKAHMSRLDSMMEQVGIRKAELNSRLLRVKSDEAAREDTIRSLEAVFDRIAGEISQKNAEQAALEKEVASLREQLTKRDNELRESQNRYHQEKSRLQALSDIAERYEGYGGSVKKVMEQKTQEPGIVGVVADIIHVQKKYEIAIETALGGNIQNIVTKDEETAKRLIRFLKEGRLGRATFLPLDSVQNPQALKAMDVLKENGVLGLASDLVETEEEYINIARSLLGRYVVVDDVDHATAIARKYNYTIRMVTLEGELLQPGGSISGGAFKNNTNFLGKRREITELEKKVAELEKVIRTADKDIVALRDARNEKRNALENLRQEIQAATIEQNTARLNLSAARARMEEESENALSLEQEQRDIETQILEIRTGKEQTAQELKDCEELAEKTQENITLWQDELSELHLKESEASSLVGEWEIEVQKMRQAQSFQQANVDRIEGELQKLLNELEQVKANLRQAIELAEEKRNNISAIEATIAASFEQQGQDQISLKEDLELKEKLSAKQKSFFTDREALNSQMTGLDKEVYHLQTNKERYQAAAEQRINYMWDEYEITLSDASAMRDESMTNLEEMKERISTIKEQIRRLGDVNVNAIEEYREVSERYTTMKTQHDDLVEAAATLEKIIEELDTAMRAQFMDKFAEINKEFDKVFKELFGGGKGTLELMEEEDILEAGIRIIAQPPGKKLQNMMQLSGGEKALSAIALLFAIQNLKPSPFALLDEIEAALDDSNVGRFAKYLHKLTRNTQFIVITHRRGTMEQVDRLYGITMQEKGVSTLVSVNMIEKDLDD